MTTAAIYTRISRDRTGSEAGVDRQRHDCEALVEARGWNLHNVFTDNDLSAYSGKARPEYLAMLDAVAAGSVDVVVSWHPDRLTRHPRELEDLIDVLEAAKCTVETVRAGAVDLGTRSGRTTARLVGAIARDESEAKSERLRAMHEAKARAGEWPGGPRPYGYRPEDGTLVVDDDEAVVVTEAAGRVLAGESLHAICTDLNGRNVPTARGGMWRTQTLKRIIVGPTTAGRREHRGEDVGPGAWPAIIDEVTHRRVAAVIDGRGRSRGRVARVSLLAGFVTCSLCGHELATARRNKAGTRVYVCPARSLGGCGGMSVVADQVDELVAAAVLARLDGADLAEVLTEAEAEGEGPELELARIEADLAALADDLGAGRVTRAEWLAARAGYHERRDVLRSEVGGAVEAAALRPFADAGALTDAWPDLSLDQRRAIIAAVVDTVPILPATRKGRGFDPSRVTVTWKA